MLGAVSIADVDQGGVDHDVLFATVEQIIEETEVPVAATDAVPRAVLIQDVHLPGRVPPWGQSLRQVRNTSATADNLCCSYLMTQTDP